MTAGKKETLYSFLLIGASKVFTYLLLLVLANFFLMETYGRASFSIYVFYIVLFFTTIGLPYAFVPWVMKKRDSASVFNFLLLINIICFVAGIIIFRKSWILPLVLSLPFMFFREVGFSFLRIRHKYHLIQFACTFSAVLTPAFAFFLIDFNEFGIVGAYALGFILSSVLIIALTFKDIWPLFRFRFSIEPIKQYLKKGFIVSLLFLSFAFLGWIDSTLLGLLSSFENVAKYNVAGPISNLITAVPVALSMFLLIRSSELSGKQSQAVLGRTLRISLAFSLILAILINSLSVALIRFFFPRYVGIEIYVMALSIGIVFFSLYTLVYSYLAGKLRPETAFVPVLLAALLNVALDILFIPKFGLWGIVIATTIAHIFAFTLLLKKLMLLRKYALVYLIVLLVPLSYYLGYFGLVVLLLAIPILLFLGLLKKEDLIVIIKTITSVSKK